jgi:hypothetical protein
LIFEPPYDSGMTDERNIVGTEWSFKVIKAKRVVSIADPRFVKRAFA